MLQLEIAKLWTCVVLLICEIPFMLLIQQRESSYVCLSVKVDFIPVNIGNPDKMTHYAA